MILYIQILYNQEICTLWFQFFGAVFASKGYLFKNIFKKTILFLCVSLVSSFAIILKRERELVALLLLSYGYRAVGWSAVCDCGISW